MKRAIRAVMALWAALALCLLISAKEKDSYKISGWVGRSSSEPASRVVITLLDGESGKVLDRAQTGIFGKYKFEGLKPGFYVSPGPEFPWTVHWERFV